MKNPAWHRDELILALDLYFDPNRGPIDKKNPKVIQLSETLNLLPIFTTRPDEEKFRNPNGVSLKLSNILAVDPSYKGKGMTRGGSLEKELFNEFVNNKKKLRTLAGAILLLAKDKPMLQLLRAIEDDETADLDSVLEGQVLYKLHKLRERNRKIVQQKKSSILKSSGKLACEVCNFDFSERYGKLGAGFIECHHVRPLSAKLGNEETKLKDLALVCANCHRMLHRKISTLSIDDLKLHLSKTNL